MDSVPIVVEAFYSSAPEIVWQAITDPEQMRKWYFDTLLDFQAEVGFSTEFTVEAEQRTFEHLWKVTDVDAPRKLSYDWSYRGYPGESHLVWELEPTEHGTHVRISHFGNETFDQSDPLFRRESGEAGWKWLLLTSLKHHLDS